MEERYRFSVDAIELGDVARNPLDFSFNSLTLSYGWLEGDVLFFTVGGGRCSAACPRTGPLAPWGQIIYFKPQPEQPPRPNNGHFLF